LSLHTDRSRSLATPLLVAALLAGLAAALFGLIGPNGSAVRLPPHAAARVGDDLIPRAAYEQALAAVAADKRDPLDAADRRRVLERLVDEALLVRHGLDLELVRRTPALRDRLVTTVLQNVRAEADARGFDKAAVRAFHERHAARFRGPDLLHVRALRVSDLERAGAALAAWRGGAGFVDLQAEFGRGGVPVPDAPLPADKLRDYLGPAPVAAAAGLDEGEIGGPVPVAGGYVVFQLAARRAGEAPPLAEVEQAVRHEMRRRTAEELLAERLTALRERYRVVIADDLD
jgi:parvulin-like peptidyl-prolyl isomerase